jgi:tetratricopeptide (TPR) repeat protein
MYIRQASPASVPTQGTVLSEALRVSGASFLSKERKFRSVIVVSDGEDHDPEALSVAQELAAKGVMINAVGVGSPGGSQIIDPSTGLAKKDLQGNIVVSKLNEQTLQQIAAATGGVYHRLDKTDATVESILKQLSGIEKTTTDDVAFRNYQSYFQWFLVAALLLLLLEFFLPEKRRESLLVLALVFISVKGLSQSPNNLIAKGNDFYKKGDYEQAVSNYRSALLTNPKNVSANFNLANAFMRLKQYKDAEELLSRMVQHTQDVSLLNAVYFNMGVAHTKQQELEASIEAYKHALIYDPLDEDARFNLQKALIEWNKNKKKQQQQKNKQEQEPKKQQSKLTKKQVENLLKALEQREQEAQKKYQETRQRTAARPEKDW